MSGQDVKVHDALVTVGQTVVDRYEITKHLGTGGFAKVFMAFDRVIEREVAIKFLDLRAIHGTDQLVQTILERFRREAKLAAKIKHRNVVNIHDIGQLDEEGYRPFIVMEVLHGRDLEDQLNDHGALEPARLLPLYVDCLDALGEAHALGIVHKDLKPSNLFLDEPGTRSETLRIVDFGIAHIKNGGADAVEEEQGPERSNRLTATGQILGTLQYLTPEYISAQIVSPALDVYQMALILTELLSGERVIDTDNAFECLRIHTFGLLEIPDYLLKSPLGPVLRRALEAEPELRYPNAHEFAEALAAIDPLSVPISPLLLGKELLVTSQFQRPDSSPALPAHRTANLNKPSTAQLATPAFADTQDQEPVQTPQRIDRAEQHRETAAVGHASAPYVLTSMENDDFDEQVLVAPSRLPLYLVALLVLVGIGAAIFAISRLLDEPAQVLAQPVVLNDTTPPQPPVRETATPPTEATPPIETSPPPVVPVETSPAQTTVEAPREKLTPKPPSRSRLSVTVVAEPSSAKISYKSKDCGNPCIVTLKRREKTSSALIISARGYETRRINVTPEDHDGLVIGLSPIRRDALIKTSESALQDLANQKPRQTTPPEVAPAQKPKQTTPPEKKPDPTGMGILN